MTDRIRTATDVPFRPAGAGDLVTFKCDKCCRIRLTPGRRRVQRLFWWCAECVEVKA